MNEQSHRQETSFTLDVFRKELSEKVSNATPIPDSAVAEVLERIQDWTSEEPFLTRVVCDFVVRYAAQVNDEDADLLVDQIIREEILNNWENNAAAIHLQRIRQTLLDYDRKDSLLILYIKVLQRGKVRKDNSPEQEVLLRSGLVSSVRGKLRVTNLIYQRIFDIDWVEAQLPGITKPVTIVSKRTRAAKSLAAVQLPLKIAAAAGALVLLTTVVSNALRPSSGPSNGRALATQGELSDAAVATGDVADRAGDRLIETATRLAKTDKELFDTGIDHGQNGRWVPMLREFCALETKSVYFAPAKAQLQQWKPLFSDGLDVALETMTYESSSEGDTCAIAQNLEQK